MSLNYKYSTKPLVQISTLTNYPDQALSCAGDLATVFMLEDRCFLIFVCFQKVALRPILGSFTNCCLGSNDHLLHRVTARTNAGEDSNEFDPASSPSSSDYAAKLVGNLTVDSWASSNNATVESAMLDLQASIFTLVFFSYLVFAMFASRLSINQLMGGLWDCLMKESLEK